MSEPLPREVFDAQLRSIVKTHGAEALIGRPDSPAKISVFAGAQALEVSGQDDPRHRYGLTYDGLPDAIEAWIANGEAYDDYLSMNICRFSCAATEESDDAD